MNIIAKTSDGYLVSATEAELKAIYSAISKPITEKNPILIGDKLPAYDYSATITKCKDLKVSFDFRQLKLYTESLAHTVKEYVQTIESLTFEE
jgi:hypothetical protein